MSAATPLNLRRWAGLGLLIVLPCVLLALAAANAVATAEIDARSTATAAQGERLRMRLANGTGVAEPALPSERLALEAPSRSLAEAELQRRLVALGETVSARIVESGSAELGSEDASALLEVRATFDLGNESLLRLLYEIETGLPLMTVTRLTVRSLDGEETDPSSEPTLRVEVSVQAAWKAPAS